MGGTNCRWSYGSHVRPVNTPDEYYKTYQKLGHCTLLSGFLGQSWILPLQPMRPTNVHKSVTIWSRDFIFTPIKPGCPQVVESDVSCRSWKCPGILFLVINKGFLKKILEFWYALVLSFHLQGIMSNFIAAFHIEKFIISIYLNFLRKETWGKLLEFSLPSLHAKFPSSSYSVENC